MNAKLQGGAPWIKYANKPFPGNNAFENGPFIVFNTYVKYDKYEDIPNNTEFFWINDSEAKIRMKEIDDIRMKEIDDDNQGGGAKRRRATRKLKGRKQRKSRGRKSSKRV